MAPLIKDSVETATSAADSSVARPAAPAAKPVANSQVRADALSVEVPVRVYGSRITQLPGQAEPNSEPFEEQTSTMIVFPQGAVLRMSTTVGVGQMLVVTNTKTKADAICRVVKVRTFSNTQGYVEVEFTTPQPNYWAMRFPSDGPAPTAAPVSAAPVAAAPVAPVTPKPAVAPKPTEVAKAPAAPVVAPPQAPAQKPVAPVAAAPVAPVTPTPKPPEPVAIAPVVPATPTKIEASAPAADLADVEDEDVETILNRLTPTATAVPASSLVPATPSLDAIFAAKTPFVSEAAAKAPVIEAAKSEPVKAGAPVDFPSAPPVTPVPSLSLSDLRGDSIAEPLGPMDDTETIATDDIAKEAASQAPAEAPRRTFGSFSGGASLTGGSSIAAASSAETTSPATHDFGARLDSSSGLTDDYAVAPKSSNFMMISACIGALAVVLGGGVFYFRTSLMGSKAVAPSVVSSQDAKSADAGNAAELSERTALRNTESANPAVAPAKSAAVATPTPVSSAPAQPAYQPNMTVTATASPRGGHAASKLIPNIADGDANAHPVAAQRTDAVTPGAAPALDAPSASAGNALSGLVSGSDGAALKAPEVHVEGPVRIGGNVKEPTLITHVMPVYPLTAKEAGIQGDVLIQTTVDQKGNVVNTKIVSGPVMLRQPALDAVRRWKYAPSTLNGQAISVQMMVTVKFSSR